MGVLPSGNSGIVEFRRKASPDGSNDRCEVLVKGKRFTDFVDLSGAIAFTQEVLDFLKARQISGFAVFPISVVAGKWKGEDLFGLRVTGQVVEHDTSRGVEWSNRVRDDGTRGILSLSGIYFDPGNWNGSDFFRVGGLSARVMSPRLCDELRASKFHGFSIVPVMKYGY